jgi:hypothetical protein
MTGEAYADISYTCSEEFLSAGIGNVIAFSDPFVPGPNGEVFLDQASVCVDGGNDAPATNDYSLIGADWTTMTTALDSSLDASPVDMGTHYTP